MKTLLKTVVLAAALAGTAAGAATLVPGGGWEAFYFDDSGSPIHDSGTGDTSWDFVLTSSALLKVTDAYVPGDSFDIFDFASNLGNTGPYDRSGPTTSDPDVAYGGSTYSWRGYLLGAGAHSISGLTVDSCCGGGGAFIELAAAVPEPANWALLIAGFGLVGASMRRRATTVVTA